MTNKFPYWSPYHFSANSPIRFTDLDGAEPKEEGKEEGQVGHADKYVYSSSGMYGTYVKTKGTWHWHAGGLLDNHENRTKAGWYSSEEYAELLSNTYAAGALGVELGLYNSMAQNMNDGETGKEELAKFVGSGLNAAASKHLTDAAQMDAKRDNYFVSGHTYQSSFNVEDAFGVVLIAKQGLKILGSIALKNLAAKETAQIIYSKIALGVSEHLDDFAKSIGGTTWKTWGTKDFQTQFLDVISSPYSKIHFNLTGPDGKMLNVWQAVNEGAKGLNMSRATSWELFQIYSNPATLERTIFYFNGNVVPNPFK